MMNFFFLFDDYTDCTTPEDTRILADMLMDALRNPDTPRPEGECIIGEAARQ